jgi:hypothetical protein
VSSLTTWNGKRPIFLSNPLSFLSNTKIYSSWNCKQEITPALSS